MMIPFPVKIVIIFFGLFSFFLASVTWIMDFRFPAPPKEKPQLTRTGCFLVLLLLFGPPVMLVTCLVIFFR